MVKDDLEETGLNFVLLIALPFIFSFIDEKLQLLIAKKDIKKSKLFFIIKSFVLM